MRLARWLLRLTMGARAPVTSGTIASPGLDEDVLVRRDRWGIPHIQASCDHDAWFALGFCHGQDRAFQLECLIRTVRGALSELFGAELLPVDRLSRRVGFIRAASDRLQSESPAIRVLVEAYSSGINDGRKRGLRRRPHELALLRADPTPCEPEDVAGVLSLYSFLLAANWDAELARLRILREDGPKALDALDPGYPEWQPVTCPPGATAGAAAASDRLEKDLTLLREVVGSGGGASNNWVVSGSRTATGRPLLANDPHLSPVLPSPWYLAHLATPSWEMAGASLVGTPAMPVGHNGHAAWGVTAGLVDNTDLFIEEVSRDGKSVRRGDHEAPCEVFEERIEVKDGPAVVEEVLVTPRGPIVSPALEGESMALSLRATWLDPRPVGGIFGLGLVRGFQDFQRCFKSWPALSMSMVYADESNSIGWQLVGDVPRRRRGRGSFPLPGWHRSVGWHPEPAKYEDLPSMHNPEAGFIATANNQPCIEGRSPDLGTDFLDGYRAARLGEVLAARDDWDLDSMLCLQRDVTSLLWGEIKEVVLGLPDTDPATKAALRLLETWDGQLSADSPAAAVFALFVTEMVRRVVHQVAPNSEAWALGKGFTPLSPRSLLIGRRHGFLSRLLREQPDGWIQSPWVTEMADALSHVASSLEMRFGPTPSRWSWGKVHTVTYRHPFGAKKVLTPVFSRGPYPVGGDVNTVAQAAVDPIDPGAGAIFTPSLRVAMDVGKWDSCRVALAGGQSGNPFSRHYDDQLRVFLRGDTVPLAFSADAVQNVAQSRLRLAASFEDE